MASVYVITEACADVKDRSCISVCPVDCIETSDDDRICYIDPGRCVGGDLCLPACPVGAIFTEETVPRRSAAFVDANARWFTERDAARTIVDRVLAQ